MNCCTTTNLEEMGARENMLLFPAGSVNVFICKGV